LTAKENDNSDCHSRESGDPELKPGFPIKLGMTQIIAILKIKKRRGLLKLWRIRKMAE
jgi:hypothetical protein